MKHFIIKKLNLKEEDIDCLDVAEPDGIDTFEYTVRLTLRRKSHRCPYCSHYTDRIKDYRVKHYGFLSVNDETISLDYRCRRYQCTFCSKSFTEDNPFFRDYRAVTPYTIESILRDFKKYTATYSSIGRKYGISATSAMNIFDKHVSIQRHRLPRIMCVDEFYFNRHARNKYPFIMMDFSNKLIIDIVESRKNNYLKKYFSGIDKKERDQVEYVCMDMYGTYRKICRIYLKNAIICTDRFHVMKKVNDTLDSIRKRIMRDYKDDSIEYKLLKFRRKLLFKKFEDIDYTRYFKDGILRYQTTEQGVLERILDISPDLKKAYLLKEEFVLLDDIEEKDFYHDAQREKLERYIIELKECGIREFIRLAKTLRNWESEILNSYVWFDGRRISNGPIEGKNNYIKKILSNANGMNNFERARNRIMYSQNRYESHSYYNPNGSKKRKGKTRGKYNKKNR